MQAVLWRKYEKMRNFHGRLWSEVGKGIWLDGKIPRNGVALGYGGCITVSVYSRDFQIWVCRAEPETQNAKCKMQNRDAGETGMQLAEKRFPLWENGFSVVCLQNLTINWLSRKRKASTICIVTIQPMFQIAVYRSAIWRKRMETRRVTLIRHPPLAGDTFPQGKARAFYFLRT